MHIEPGASQAHATPLGRLVVSDRRPRSPLLLGFLVHSELRRRQRLLCGLQGGVDLALNAGTSKAATLLKVVEVGEPLGIGCLLAGREYRMDCLTAYRVGRLVGFVAPRVVSVGLLHP